MKLHPALAFAIITYLLALGVSSGIVLNEVAATRRQVEALTVDVSHLRTRGEADEIVKRLEQELAVVNQRLTRLEGGR